jgi:hypothetical protein
MARSVFSGIDVAGVNPRQMADAWRKLPANPRFPMGRLVNNDPKPKVITPPQVQSPAFRAPLVRSSPGMTAVIPGMNPSGRSNPYASALNNIRAGGVGSAAPGGGTTTMTPRSPGQNAFTEAIRARLSQNMNNGALTKFVQDAYKKNAGAEKALEQENAALDKVFSDKGLANELMNSRAKRKASVMMATKMALDRAKRNDSVNRMMGGNNSYLARAYGDNISKILSGAAIQDADLERDDLRYVQGERMGALGARDNLLRNYLNTSLLPTNVQRQFLREDIDTGSALANLEDRNNIYETPLQRMQREIQMAEGLDYLQQRAYAGA